MIPFQMYYSVALKNGQVNAWFGTGQGQPPTKLVSAKRYDDGDVHSVSVYRNGPKSVSYSIKRMQYLLTLLQQCVPRYN